MMSREGTTRWARLIVQIITTLFLLISLLLTLLLLLTPTSKANLSMFTIKPIGQDRAIVKSTPTGEPIFGIAHDTIIDGQPTSIRMSFDAVPSADMGDIRGRQLNISVRQDDLDRSSYPHHAPLFPGSNTTGITAGGLGDKEGLMMYWWLGMHGPSIHVGAMHICSKPTVEDEIICTSSSRGSYHASFLPYTLADPLMMIPTAPPAPALLLVGGTCALIATMLYLWGIFITTSFAQKCRKMKDKANVLSHYPSMRKHTRQPSIGSISSFNSSTTLVNPAHMSPAPEEEGKGRVTYPHLAFLVLSVMAFSLATAATTVEMVIISRAKTRWNEVEAGRVGMKFELGVLAYLMPCLPIIILLAILIAYTPAIYTSVGRRGKSSITKGDDIESVSVKGSMIETKDISAPEHIETTRIPEEWTRVSLDRPSRPSIAAPAPTGPLRPSRPPSGRQSWRNTFSSTVGMAV